MSGIIDNRGNVHDRGTGRFKDKARRAAAGAADLGAEPDELDDLYDMELSGGHLIPARAKAFGPVVKGSDGREYTWVVRRKAYDGDQQKMVAVLELADAETGRRPGELVTFNLKGMRTELDITSNVPVYEEGGELQIPDISAYRKGEYFAHLSAHDGPVAFRRYQDEFQAALRREAEEHPEIFRPADEAERRAQHLDYLDRFGALHVDRGVHEAIDSFEDAGGDREEAIDLALAKIREELRKRR